MGLDIGVKLIVGVPLERLGEIVETEHNVPKFDILGRQVGEVTMYQLYLRNAKADFLIGTNELALARGYGEIDNDFEGFQHESWREKWLHMSDYEGGYSQTVIGLEMSPIMVKESGRTENFRTYLNVDMSEVKQELKDVFGYEGDVFLIAMATYSY